MSKMVTILRSMGWDEELIQHFMIEDRDIEESTESIITNEIYDTNSITLTVNEINGGSNLVFNN